MTVGVFRWWISIFKTKGRPRTLHDQSLQEQVSGFVLWFARAINTLPLPLAWLKSMRALDGVVAKRRAPTLSIGQSAAMQKIQTLRTLADCVVGGLSDTGRPKSGRFLAACLALGLYVRKGSSAWGFHFVHLRQRAAHPRSLVLKTLIEPPGFTGRAPRAEPSR